MDYSESLILPKVYANVIRSVFSFPASVDAKHLMFDISYVADKRVTNFISQLEIRDRLLWFNGRSVSLDGQVAYYD